MYTACGIKLKKGTAEKLGITLQIELFWRKLDFANIGLNGSGCELRRRQVDARGEAQRTTEDPENNTHAMTTKKANAPITR